VNIFPVIIDHMVFCLMMLALFAFSTKHEIS